MHPLITTILRAASDPSRASAQLHSPPPSPWQTWLLVALTRQVERQRWLMRVWREILDQRGERHGALPGMPGWTFMFHGSGLCATAPDGEIVDVDDYGDDGLTIDPFFFARRIASLSHPPLPEERLRAFLPNDASIVVVIRDLTALGLLVPHERGHVFRVVPELEAVAASLSAIDFSDRARWAEHFGDDDLLARERGRAGDHERARSQREAYKHYLLAGISRGTTPFLEPAEAVLSPQELVDVCAVLIDSGVNSTAGHTIEQLHRHLDYPVCDAVQRLLGRADPTQHHPYAVHEAARYMLCRGLDRALAVRVALSFARVDAVAGYRGNPYLGDLALLLLEHAPEHALPLLQRGLRSDTPVVQQRTAAALVVLAQPWCLRELLLALEAATTLEDSQAVRAAILCFRTDEARAAVDAWNTRHAPQGSPGRVPRSEEARAANAEEFLEHETTDLRAWGDALRARIDPDFDRVVWG